MEFRVRWEERFRIIILCVVMLGVGFIAGCSYATKPEITRTANPVYTSTYTPFQPLPPEINETQAWETMVSETTSTVTPQMELTTSKVTNSPDESHSATAMTLPTATQNIQALTIDKLRVWIDETVPKALEDSLVLEGGVQKVDKQDQANLVLGATDDEGSSSRWIYALVAPFPTVEDGVTSEEIMAAWGGDQSLFGGSPILLNERTLSAFTSAWGKPVDDAVRVVSDGDMVDIAWAERPSWAIIPFEDLVPEWKVLQIDGTSPISKEFDSGDYLLAIDYGFMGKVEALTALAEQGQRVSIQMAMTNRDPNKLTVVVMTGVTALVRATGAKMEANGMTYPATDISDWLLEADITHVSNEVSFAEDCPNADPYQKTLRFCSRPEYIELLDAIDVDVIELSGNHLLDWNPESFLWTLDLYDERGWGYYAGGSNESEARQALKITHNGNRLAFIGCNLVGPPNDWATENSPGTANCGDYAWLLQSVGDLVDEGFLPIVTLQHNEFYSLEITPSQIQDFQPLAQAGAVIVSGSQAHYPNPFGFVEGNFIHYGLGNLFFDQMDSIIADGIQREFLDRHVFYDNQYISTEILTAHLEEFSRPRPMTEEERAAFLEEAFTASGW